MSATIKDVANEAGLSVATVSRVLNNSANVSDEAAEKVNMAIEKLGYSPNFLGRNLRKRETNVILVLMPTSEHSFYMKIVAGIQKYAQPRGYDIICASSNSTSEIEVRQMNMLFNRTVDGVILLGTSYDADTLNKLSKNYNIALCCEGVEGAELLTVVVDDEQAAYDAIKELIRLGHRKIGFVGANDSSASSKNRHSGYVRAMKEFLGEVREEYIYTESFEYECGQKALEYFRNLSDPPTAVFCVSDLLAISVIHKAHDLGMKIGEEISVMGFDNISMCEMMLPTVSTVEQPCEKLGEMVVRKLISNIGAPSGAKDNGYYTVPHRVILRDSTGNIKK
ncbi:LacI family transcriptional regulator [Ruminococcus sp. YE71]|uniref:LacI family DNA-binding transcriptional regulator n=1 Tax=unclassified Ruminococcus TaxID=2608920 RepID=UPI0008926C72|nr:MULTISPECIES: LacI family DNA-binding transcriptional regulator [unclassified Ruminococcus]SDA21110.1 LacI family transcriptional regulator [Ruminococcus sp. YE78]SFW33035.1 LacI family transcriptional regulator [Ruminococcus sp. YE71]